MANWTKAELAEKVLSRLGITPAGQGSNADDAKIVKDAIDSKHSELQTFGLVPFTTSAIPEWAQQPMVKIIAGVVAPDFGFTGQSLSEKTQLGVQGRRELEEVVSSPDEIGLDVVVDYY